MEANVNALARNKMPCLPLNPDAVKDALKRGWVAESGVIAATLAATLLLSHALRVALENYTILGL